MRKIWLIAFLFNISMFVLAAEESSSSPLPLYLQKNAKVNFSVKTELLRATVHLMHEKVSWGTSFTFSGAANKLTIESGNIVLQGSVSNLNNPSLSSTISPFSMANISSLGIISDFENSDSFSKPLSFYTQYSFTNKNKNRFYISGFFTPFNKNFAISNGFTWNINNVIQTKDKTVVNKTTYNLFLTAGFFSYDELKNDSWFLSQQLYSKGFQPAISLEANMAKEKVKTLFNVNLYFSPFGNALFTFRNENEFKIKNTSLNISEYFNFGSFNNNTKFHTFFSTNGNKLKEEIQIKINLQNESKTKLNNSLKKGITLYSDFDLFNTQHIFKTSLGLSLKNKKVTNSFFSNMNFSYKPDTALCFNDFNIKYGLSFIIKSISISTDMNFTFYPPENLFIKNQSEKNWKNEQSISLGIKNSGQFSASSKISATLFENGYEPEKIKIEYSLGLFYKKKWFTGSISLKDHITCEF